MPKMVYHQLKNVAKKTILRVLERQPDLEGGDPVKHQPVSQKFTFCVLELIFI